MAEGPERNLRLLMEYDGTRYAGWQLQDELPTIQGEVVRAIEQVTSERPTVRVAGRTDAGVHARGQVATFEIHHALPAHRFPPALNNYLPKDISVHTCEEVAADFDVRRDSVSKRYRYRVHRGPQPAALEQNRAWFRRQPLDLETMRAAASHLVGEHDFDAFRSAHCDAAHAVREMISVVVESSPRPPHGEYIDIYLHANAFCRHMCRILAGTLVEVGLGKRGADDVRAVLASRDRTRAGVTAPAAGLTLMEVLYE